MNKEFSYTEVVSLFQKETQVINKERLEYQFSLPIYFLGLSLIMFLTLILCFATYIFIIKDFYIAIVIFIWLLYGLIFRDSIPKIIRIGRNILMKRPALILSNHELIDNINAQKFDWTEIEEICEYDDTRSGSYIAIKVKNPNKYLSNEKSYYNRMIMQYNQKYWNGIVAIRPREIKCNKKELLKNLKLYFNRD